MKLSDSIAAFIKNLMEEETNREIEIKRNELAEFFRCAPSQINYVLSTRFTPDHGYSTESTRGGGGCIKIIRLSGVDIDYVNYLLNERIKDGLSEREALILCQQLVEREYISLNEGRMIHAALNKDALSLPLPEAVKDALRAKILRSMLVHIAKGR